MELEQQHTITVSTLLAACEGALAELDTIAEGWDAFARRYPRDVSPWQTERRRHVESERLSLRAALKRAKGE